MQAVRGKAVVLSSHLWDLDLFQTRARKERAKSFCHFSYFFFYHAFFYGERGNIGFLLIFWFHYFHIRS